jgi:outer membrane protein
MRRTFPLLLTLASGLAVGAFAQSPAPTAKVAVVTFQMALAQTNEGQRAFADLQKKFAPKRDEMKAQVDEITNLTKQLQTDGAKLTDAERAGRAKTLEEKKKKAQRFGEDAQKEFEAAMQEMTGSLASKFYDVLTAYATQQGYTLVLDVGEQQSPVIYTGPTIDITKALVAAYNTKSGVPPMPAQQAPAKAPAAK